LHLRCWGGCLHLRVAFQGEHGAYSEEAIVQHFGLEAEPIPCPSLREVFESTERGRVDLGLVPVENTLEGSIAQTHDLLLASTLMVQSEVILRVVHCLISNPGVSMRDVRRVYSHPQALGQCRPFLEGHGLEIVDAYDTAGSVKMLRDGGLTDAAAVAGGRAAEEYGMAVLARGIESHPDNYTRFLILGRADHERTGRDKTSVACALADAPGALFRALGCFAERGVGLSRIETRPIAGSPWAYHYFMDLEGHRDDPLVTRSLGALRARARWLRVLGSYPRAV
jgi:prephenate dehydratase